MILLVYLKFHNTKKTLIQLNRTSIYFMNRGRRMSRNFVFQLTVVIFISTALINYPKIGEAGIVSIHESTTEMFLGKSDAPVTMIEYASLGCSHCADFHKKTYPKIKEEFVKKGKLKIIFRNFPLGTPSLAAAMIAHCAGPKRFFGMIEIFFQSQQQWGRSKTPIDSLKKVARFGGITGADVDQCISNEHLLKYIQEVAEKGQKQFQINSTPSFIINGKIISGALPYVDFKKAIDSALKEAN